MVIPNGRKVIHAHDQFARMALTDPRVAREFFTMHLPAEILDKIDLGHLVLQPRSHIDTVRRKESIVDILYKTTMGDKEIYLYLLVEHQSTVDKLMPFRILQYICNIIDGHLKHTKTKEIPFVYPLVIYHAKQPYPCSTDIRDLVKAPKELVEKYFLKPFQLIDLTQIQDEEMRKHAWGGVMEFALKHVFASDILSHLKGFVDVMQYVEQTGGGEYISSMLQYLFGRGQVGDKEAFFQLVNEVSLETGEKVMTLAEQFKQEGLQEGLQQAKTLAEQFKQEGVQQGREEKAMEIASRLLEEGADMAFAAKVSGLPINQILELQQTN